MGYGVIEKQKNQNTLIDFGVIKTPKEDMIAARLLAIEHGIIALIEKYKTEELAVEELFFAKNVKTAITVAHARGVILLACYKKCGKLFEYTPLQIKQALTGYGRADKNQIQQMVKVLLKLKTVPKPDDAADALAVALCHSQTGRLSAEFKIK